MRFVTSNPMPQVLYYENLVSSISILKNYLELQKQIAQK